MNCEYGKRKYSSVSIKVLILQFRSHILLRARVTSAAPPYFGPYRGYHDGGLGGHNNPVKLGLWEQNLIWGRKNKQPDCVVSIGTGSNIVNESESNVSASSWMSELFLPRLVRSFMALLDGQKTWTEVLNSIATQHHGRYHRFNLSFPGPEPEPAIDAIESMRELKLQVESQATRLTSEIRGCADNLIASLFYIELIEMPIFKGYKFHCKGRVLCQLGPSTALHNLTLRLQHTQSRFYINCEEKVCVDDALYKKVKNGGSFSVAVEFTALSKEDKINLKIEGLTQRARDISNFPYLLEDMCQDQKFNHKFGRPDHKEQLGIHRTVDRRVERDRSKKAAQTEAQRWNDIAKRNYTVYLDGDTPEQSVSKRQDGKID
jgi:hypothetical protein